jgi:DNA-3-methyladenine glycosylase I
MSYCTYCKTLPENNRHRIYHDNHYGFPIESDNELFERFIFEINQAGLSWDLILKKQETFRQAYHQFNIAIVAGYDETEIKRLLNDQGIVRNKLKVNAAIYNAKVIVKLQEEMGSFKNWIDHHHPKSKEDWVRIFKKTFKFTGGEIVNEFLMSTGYLKGAHDEDCPILNKINNGMS